MTGVKNYKFWFCTGSQDLYGEACLAHVAEHSRGVVERRSRAGRRAAAGVGNQP